MAAGNMEPALQRNRAFAEAAGHENLFPGLGLMVVTCLDPRVDPAQVLGIRLGDAMVIRNVGGRLTREVLRDVAFVAEIAAAMQPDGPLFEVAVIHHTQCGAAALADDAFRRRYAERVGVEESTLREYAVVDPVETVVRDVERLKAAPSISSRISVSGHVYDVTSGLVQTVVWADGVSTGDLPVGEEAWR